MAARADMPDVLLVTVDALRPDRLGCYGGDRAMAPHIDRLADSACVFETAWAAGPNTPASFPGLMASRTAFQSGSLGVGEAPVTLAELLRSQGYGTFGFNAGNPYVSRFFGYDRGFDELRSFLEHTPTDGGVFDHVPQDEAAGTRVSGAASAVRRAFRGARAALKVPLRALGLLRPLEPLWRPVLDHMRYWSRFRVKLDLEERYWSAVSDWLEAPPERPFFLWLHPMTVHEPYCPPARCQREVAGRALSMRRMIALRRAAGRVAEGDRSALSDRDVRELRMLYDAEVRRMDERLGVVLDALRRQGRLERCLLIVTSDHGEQFMEHGRCFHPSFHFNETLRVPLLVRLPGEDEGRRVEREVGLVDLLPTVADLLGAELPDGACVGRSFAPLLRGEEMSTEGRLFVSESFYGPHGTFYQLDCRDLRRVKRRVSFQNRCIKLAADGAAGTCSVFDLRSDPGEEDDLSGRRPELEEAAMGLARCHFRRAERERVRRAFPGGPPGGRP
ncbi:MAG: sulfatase [Candidatus Brocadiia bacterium]